MLALVDADRYERVSLLTRRSLELPPGLATNPRVKQIRSALDRPERYAAAVDSTTVILHLAARVGRARPSEFERDNVEGTRAIVRVAEERGAAGLVNVSSIAAKFPETAYYPYADSKREAERIVATCQRPWITVRPTIVLGRDSPIWSKFRQLARGPLPVVPGNPATRIQPIHVDDLAAVLLGVIDDAVFDRTVCELGGAEAVTVEDFIRRLRGRLTGRGGVTVTVPIALGMPLLRAFERLSPVPLPVTEGQLSSFIYDGIVDPNPLQERYADRLRGVDAILDDLTA